MPRTRPNAGHYSQREAILHNAGTYNTDIIASATNKTACTSNALERKLLSAKKAIAPNDVTWL